MGTACTGLRAQADDRAFAELLLDLAEGGAQGARAFFFVHGGSCFFPGEASL